jgi:pimeloyl-ACP methyl ester carboxylesterase
MENCFELQHEVALPIYPRAERRATPRPSVHAVGAIARDVGNTTHHQGSALAVDPLMRTARNPQTMALDWDVIEALVANERAKSDNIAPLPGIDHSGFATFKRMLRFVAKQSPALADRLGTRVLTTPPKARPKRAHAERIALATQFPLNIGGTLARGYAWGSGPAVIFSHGWCADASWFAPYITQLNLLGFQVVAFDAPGHGFAARGRTDMFGFAACIGGASDWVMANGGRVQAVVGHSFGAVAAAIAMRDWNIPCDRLALISAFTDCSWVAKAFVQMAELPPQVGDLMCAQHKGFGEGPMAHARTSVIDMIRQEPKHVLLAHDRDDSEVPFWHGLALYEGCRRAEFYQTRGQGHRKILRESGLVDAVIKFVSR